MTEDLKPLPVKGYTPQSEGAIALVNEFKADEERLLRKLDHMQGIGVDPWTVEAVKKLHYDHRWLAIARTHFQEGFMALNRAVFQPQRINLPEDGLDDATPTLRSSLANSTDPKE